MAEGTGIREFLRGPAGRAATVAVLVIGLAAVGYEIWTSVRTDPTTAGLNDPLFIDAETGKTFHQALSPTMTIPVKSPYTGRNTGYEAELCYWTKDGKPKADPTGVLLNETVGKPGPTFCPDCGRLVKSRNPTPAQTNNKPPPTQAEYEAQHKGSEPPTDGR